MSENRKQKQNKRQRENDSPGPYLCRPSTIGPGQVIAYLLLGGRRACARRVCARHARARAGHLLPACLAPSTAWTPLASPHYPPSLSRSLSSPSPPLLSLPRTHRAAPSPLHVVAAPTAMASPPRRAQKLRHIAGYLLVEPRTSGWPPSPPLPSSSPPAARDRR